MLIGPRSRLPPLHPSTGRLLSHNGSLQTYPTTNIADRAYELFIFPFQLSPSFLAGAGQQPQVLATEDAPNNKSLEVKQSMSTLSRTVFSDRSGCNGPKGLEASLRRPSG